MTEISSALTGNIVLEANQRLSRSLLWKIQRQFFEQQRSQVGTAGQDVPQAVTRDCFMARAFCQVVFGFLQDWFAVGQVQAESIKKHDPKPDRKAEVGSAGLDFSQPVYILELGAGSGRFAYHFLRQFFADASSSVLQEVPVQYVMIDCGLTDCAQQTLEFWQSHPFLQPFVERGVLDFACFDGDPKNPLQLRQSGEILTTERLKNPLIVLANSFWGAMPQDLFAIRDGQLYETLLTLTVPESAANFPAADLLEHLQIAYDDRPVAVDYYDRLAWNQWLQEAQQSLTTAHFCFPVTALSCLDRLRQWAGDRLLWLSVDEDDGENSVFNGLGRPRLAFQDSVSLRANDFAIGQYVQSQGGQALRTCSLLGNLQVQAFLFGGLGHCRETQLAYDDAMQNTGLEDFFKIQKRFGPRYLALVNQGMTCFPDSFSTSGLGRERDAPTNSFIPLMTNAHYLDLSLPEILNYLRCSGWNSTLFLGCLPVLMAQVESAPAALQQEIHQAIQQVWAQYYWVGEAADLPLQLSQLLAKMDCYGDAVEYLEFSLQLYGESSERLLHQATCYLQMGQEAESFAVLEQALALQSQAEKAGTLRRTVEVGSGDTGGADTSDANPGGADPGGADRGESDPGLDSDGETGTDRRVEPVKPPFAAAPSSVRSLDGPPKANDPDPLLLDFSGLRQALERHIAGKPALPLAALLAGEPVTLSRLGELFQLSPFERAILFLCLGLEVEPQVQSLCGRIQGDAGKSYASLGLALSVFPEANWAVLALESPLHRWRLIQVESGRLLTQAPIQLDRRVLCYLLDQPTLAGPLANLVTACSPAEGFDALPPSYQAVVQQVVRAWSVSVPRGQWPLICLTGTDTMMSGRVAGAVCDRIGLHLMTLSAAVLPANPHELKQLQRYWEREAVLSDSVLLLTDDAAIATDPSRANAIALFLETLGAPAMASSCDRKPWVNRPAITLEVPALSHPEKVALWRAHLSDRAAELDGDVDVLASQFKLNLTAIQTICTQATSQGDSIEAEVSDHQQAATPAAAQAGTAPSLRDRLWHFCRLQARPNLDDLAQRIEASATWDDLVLPERQSAILADIETHLRHRSRVYQDWGFAQKGNRGLGISTLFYGESGTGKTMAAEVLARNCQLDLYRIDLSTVVSKYIGETEKNLRRIFDAAETGGAILLFDEADALFGKRSEVKDSHDRHANIEVSYLLQRMEAYQGLAILTTNLKSSLDQAFLRRLRFMLPFPFPDPEARSQIWQRIFPAQTPQQQLDYEKLGQLKVAGGNIRNIALNAAFLAAAANEPIQMRYILQAAQREYLKLEKLLTNEEIKDWDLT